MPLYSNDMTLGDLGATCDTCLFWHYQQCRALSPSPAPMLAASPKAVWPITLPEDGCGRHPAVQIYLSGLTKAVNAALEDPTPTDVQPPTGDTSPAAPSIGPKAGRAPAKAKEASR